jgi:hypothetical protein
MFLFAWCPRRPLKQHRIASQPVVVCRLVPNPLFSFVLPRDVRKWKAGSVSLRHPRGGISNAEAVRYELRIHASDFTDNQVKFLQSATAEDAWTHLEDTVHGEFHVYFGGDRGFMSSVGLAAFDPIFFLHHCNVERLFFAWQLRHPGQVPPRFGTETPLKPFLDVFPGKDMRDPNVFGTNYDRLPELPPALEGGFCGDRKFVVVVVDLPRVTPFGSYKVQLVENGSTAVLLEVGVFCNRSAATCSNCEEQVRGVPARFANVAAQSW